MRMNVSLGTKSCMCVICVYNMFFFQRMSPYARWACINGLLTNFPNKFYQELSHESFKVHMNELVRIGLHECTWGAHILFLPQLLCINHKK